MDILGLNRICQTLGKAERDDAVAGGYGDGNVAARAKHDDRKSSSCD
jgi:hypothetical protein